MFLFTQETDQILCYNSSSPTNKETKLAHVSKDVITKARAALKVLNKEYGIKTTLSGQGGSCMYLTVASGSIDFVDNYCLHMLRNARMQDVDSSVAYIRKEQYINVNQYYLEDCFSGKALEYLQKANAIMHADHYDHSDIQSDYFNCAYYVNINVGRWNKPYKLV